MTQLSKIIFNNKLIFNIDLLLVFSFLLIIIFMVIMYIALYAQVYNKIKHTIGNKDANN